MLGLCRGKGGELTWQHVDRARLTMRGFSDPFLDAYVGAEGNMLLKSVGGYRIEGQGIHLFSKRSKATISPSSACRCCRFLGYLRDTGWLPE